MNKKEYIKPTAKQIIISNESLLAGSDPNVVTASFGGDDGGVGEAESKHYDLWDYDDDEY